MIHRLKRTEFLMITVDSNVIRLLIIFKTSKIFSSLSSVKGLGASGASLEKG